MTQYLHWLQLYLRKTLNLVSLNWLKWIGEESGLYSVKLCFLSTSESIQSQMICAALSKAKQEHCVL